MSDKNGKKTATNKVYQAKPGGHFAKGNPGRPKGSRNRRTQLLEDLGDGAYQTGLDWMRTQIKEGNQDVIISVMSGMSNKIPSLTYFEPWDMGPTTTVQEILHEASRITIALSKGEISREHATELRTCLHDNTNMIAHLEWEPFLEKMLELKKRGKI